MGAKAYLIENKWLGRSDAGAPDRAEGRPLPGRVCLKGIGKRAGGLASGYQLGWYLLRIFAPDTGPPRRALM